MNKNWLCIFSLVILTACNTIQGNQDTLPATIPPVKTEATPTQATVKITMEVVPPDLYPFPTPVICTSLPKGMTLSAKPVSPTSLQLDITGLQPGESLILVLRSQGNGHNVQMEGHPVLTAGPDGRFVYVVQGLSPPPGTKHWTIQVVHSRGVACTDVVLP